MAKAKTTDEKKLFGMRPAVLGAAAGGLTGGVSAPKKNRVEYTALGVLLGAIAGAVYENLS